MMAKRAEDRFQTMHEVVAALEACQPAQNHGATIAWLPSQVSPPLVPLPMAIPIAVSTSTNLNQTADSASPTFEFDHRTLLTLTDSPAVKKTWSLTAKIIGATFGTIIAPLVVALIGNYLQQPKTPPSPPNQTAPMTPAITISQPVAPVITTPQPVAPASAKVATAVTATATAKAPPAEPVLTDGKPFDVLAMIDPPGDTAGG